MLCYLGRFRCGIEDDMMVEMRFLSPVICRCFACDLMRGLFTGPDAIQTDSMGRIFDGLAFLVANRDYLSILGYSETSSTE
jgi:hypothetical protein